MQSRIQSAGVKQGTQGMRQYAIIAFPMQAHRAQKNGEKHPCSDSVRVCFTSNGATRKSRAKDV
jgi:hypothetical protein